MKKVLLTGANGLLGPAVVKSLNESVNLLATARQESYCNATEGFSYRPLNIARFRECKDVISEFEPDVIVNTAAFTHVDRCETERGKCWQANVRGVENLAKAARRNMAQLIHLSTDYVFDGTEGPYDETHLPNPLGYYGKSKLASENAVRMIGIPYAIIRTNVVYGVGTGIKNNFLLWVYNNLKSGNRINVVTDQFNNPTLADDLAEGIRLLIEQSKYGIFNLAGEEYLSRYEFACIVARVFGFSLDLIQPITSDALEQTAPRPMRGGLIIDKAKKELGYRPRTLAQAFEYLAPALSAES